jgi:hypothetical protein
MDKTRVDEPHVGRDGCDCCTRTRGLVYVKKNVGDNKTQRNEALDKPSEGIVSLGRSSPLLQCRVVWWWSLDWLSIIQTLAVQRATIEKGRGTHVWTMQCLETHAALEKKEN